MKLKKNYHFRKERMSIEQIYKLKVINTWLKDIIKTCEHEAFSDEPVNPLLGDHVLPYLRDQEYQTFIKLTKAEDNPKEII
jgi:hypothetical protein